MKTKRELIKEEFRKNGYVTRNWALRNYISRLAADVKALNDSGWVVKGEKVETPYGVDYKYVLLSEPNEKK